jgi:anti-anti-sigma factor
MPDTPPQHGQLVIDMQSDDVRHITIRPAGELDLATVVRLEDVLRRVENDHGGAIVLDLGGLTFIDSTGISTLVKAWRRSHANGDRLRVRGATGQGGAGSSTHRPLSALRGLQRLIWSRRLSVRSPGYAPPIPSFQQVGKVFSVNAGGWWPSPCWIADGSGDTE